MTATPAFEINGIRYRTKAMDARRQLHVAAKLVAPFTALADKENAISSLGRAMADMNPNDMDFVINSCLVLVEREAPGGAAWSPIMTPEGMFMFEELRTDLAVVMQMVAPILEANVKGFLSALPQDLITKLMDRFASVSN